MSHEKSAPIRWSDEDGVAWKTPLVGSGISSPIIWEDRVFVTASDGKNQSDLHIICLDVKSGKQRWDTRLWGAAPTRHHASKSSMASPTPITDGRFLYAFFGTGDVFCVDFDGRLMWHRSLALEYGRFENRFSATSSPLLYQEKLFVQCDHYGDSYVVALDKQTGADVWRVDRPGKWLSWSSPQLAPLTDGEHATDGKPTAINKHELVLCSSTRIDALDPQTGDALWTLGGMQRECIPTPVLGHGLIYAVSGPKGATYAIRPGGRRDVTQSHVEWQSNRGAPFVPSAILVGDLYYLVDDQGVATCLNAHTGKRVWQKRLPGDYTASPVACGGRIYFTNEEGLTTILQADTNKFVELARNPLHESVFASAAVSQGRLFLRTTKQLFCINGNSN